MVHCLMDDERGSASVEFALVALMLLTLLFGTFVYGHYFAVRIALTQVASEAARAAVSGLDESERTSLVNATVGRMLSGYGAFMPAEAVTVTSGPVAGAPDLYRVQVQFQFARFGYGSLRALLPLPDETPTQVAIAARGGY